MSLVIWNDLESSDARKAAEHLFGFDIEANAGWHTDLQEL